MKVKIKKHKYFGYLQGYKVYINGKKYPLQKGYVYSSMKKETALNDAMNDYKKEMYLDYLNNFLTIEKFASYYNMTEKDASKIINEGRNLHNILK
tara:strand:- start:204 stop:488 length:285 start_codon:yes stop_codon:yes gene_type:complete